MKRTQIAKGVSKKKTKAGGITMPHFNLHDKAVIIMTPWNSEKTDTHIPGKE